MGQDPNRGHMNVIPPLVSGLLSDLASEKPLVFFDLETTGADRLTDRIVEIGAARFEKGREVSFLEKRVNPGIRIPREATAIHGISDADVKSAPRFSEIIPELDLFFGSADLSGYNVRAFDIPLLVKEYERAGQVFHVEGRKIIDAQTIFFKKEPRDLAAALRFFTGKDHSRAHSSLGDAVAAAEVLAGELEKYRDLPRSVGGLAQVSAPPEGRYVDPDKRFFWRDGEAVFAFGEYRGTTLKEVARTSPGYLEWMLIKDFPNETKKIVREALVNRNFPERS